jgi:hypothetical protein
MRSTVCYATEDGRGFKSFMYGPFVASLFGLKQDEVFRVVVRDLKEGEVSKYWAWWNSERKEFIPGMIWPHPSGVEMCFPYGTAIMTKEGKGEKVNVFVERHVESSAESK